MFSTETIQRIVRESYEEGVLNRNVLVSVDGHGEARWGEVVALEESHMKAALQEAGLDPEGCDEMLTAEEFLDEYLPTIGDLWQEENDRLGVNALVRRADYTLDSGEEVALIDDGCCCWLADPVVLEQVCAFQVRPWVMYAEDLSSAWYQELCDFTPSLNDPGLIERFEAEVGRKNWA